MNRIGMGLLLLVIASPLGFALDHPDPYGSAEIEFSGWPHYIEDLTVGSPVSDYGSHYGIKLTATRDGLLVNALSPNHLLNSAQYAAFTGFSGQVDQIYFYFRVEDFGYVFAPAEERTADFTCWGWEEEVSDGDFSAVGHVSTIDTDAFLLHSVVSAPSGVGRVKPYVVLHLDRDGIDESLNPLNFWAGYEFEFDPLEQTVDVTFLRLGSPLYRTLRMSFEIVNVYFRQGGKEIVIEGNWLEWSAEDSKTVYAVIGAGLTPADAQAACQNGFQQVESAGPENILDLSRERWDRIFSSLPPPHISDDDAGLKRLYEMAACGLVMNLYSPRNAMTSWCGVPAKAHFNKFWGWDTAFQALGLSNFDIQMAKDSLRTLFSGPYNRAYLEMGDSLYPTFGLDLTQSPVQGKITWEVFVRDGMQDTAWLDFMYRAGKSYLEWWEDTRDPDADGLYEWASSLETGWDDSPRFGCSKDISVCIRDIGGFEPVDVNSWLYEYYLYAAKMAEALGHHAEAQVFDYKARLLAATIDSELYDPILETYFDRKPAAQVGHELVKVFTPAVFWPLAVGMVKSPERAMRLIERYLLDPAYFWYSENGFAVPTVAFSDPWLDAAQDGYYWQGQVWLVTNYMATLALWRYGYEDEARELARRTLEMMVDADANGIYETYDPHTGEIGFTVSGRLWGGVGEPSAFQFGWSCAFATELLLERYQKQRYLMPNDVELSGYLAEVTNIATGDRFFWLPEDVAVPRSCISSGSGQPLGFDPDEIVYKASDPYEQLESGSVHVCFGLAGRGVFKESGSGDRHEVEVESEDDGLCFDAELGESYILVRLEEEREEIGGVCGCSM